MVNHRISKESGISFWYTFSAWFFQKIVAHIILYQLIKLQCQTFLSFSRYWRKSLIKFSLRQLMTSWTLRFIFDQPLKQQPTRKKRGESEYVLSVICLICVIHVLTVTCPNGLVVKVLNSQSRGSMIRTIGWSQRWLNLSSFCGWSSECQKFLGT